MTIEIDFPPIQERVITFPCILRHKPTDMIIFFPNNNHGFVINTGKNQRYALYENYYFHKYTENKQYFDIVPEGTVIHITI